MLHLSTMQAKEKPLEPETFNMVELVIDCMEDFRNTHGNSVTLLFKHEHDSIGVFLDKKQIKAVLTNLISNAIKYSLPGDPIVCNLSKTDTFITLSISDKGIGIPEDDLKHLFEPFYRASNVINLPGTGLGLNIVKETVDRHQGKISVSSKVGEGSEFRIILPKTI
jgi:signal transduction histidine kinase